MARDAKFDGGKCGYCGEPTRLNPQNSRMRVCKSGHKIYRKKRRRD